VRKLPENSLTLANVILERKTWKTTFDMTHTEKHNNNKMERLNGEICDREEVTRNLKKDDSPVCKSSTTTCDQTRA
jgi:hypothetical protein